MISDTRKAESREPRVPLRPSTALVVVALAMLGYLAVGGSTLGLVNPNYALGVLGILLAALGWVSEPGSSSMKRYLLWAFLLSLWILVSGIAAWGDSIFVEATVAARLLLIVPGLALLLRNRTHLHGLLFGIGVAVARFVVVATGRLVKGQPVLDVIRGDPTGFLLQTNRNAVNAAVLLLVPFLLIGVRPFRHRFIRWPLLGLSAAWLINSGGRAGLVGLAVVLIVVGMLQPSSSRRLRASLFVVLVGAFGFTWIQTVGGQAAVSTDRLVDLLRGHRTPSDEARELILRKAWDLALQNPAFGVGFENFEGTYSSIAEDASSARVRDIVINRSEHNTYAAFLAETGFPGLVAFLGFLGTLLVIGIRNLGDRFSQAAACAFAGNMFVMFFQSAFGTRFYLAIVLLLAVQRHGPAPSQVDHSTRELAASSGSP